MTALKAVALRSNWRKVSSTENLQALDDDELAAGVCGLHPSLRSRLTGVALLALAVALLTTQALTVASKLLPVAAVGASPLIAALHADEYYGYLVPLTLPVLLLAVTANWFSLKLFKHNS